MFDDVFIAIYTHVCKTYCDSEFFKNLFDSDIGNAAVMVVDNSMGVDYLEKLKTLCGNRARVEHIDVSREDQRTLFLRNVTDSLTVLRQAFLDGPYKYFIILESDVIPEKDWLHSFMEVKDKAGIIGGIYYAEFHGQHLFTKGELLEYTTHALSGCTLYNREVIERFPFRWSESKLDAFPDAWISYDARSNGFRVANYTKIQCQHLGGCSRGHDKIT